MDAHVSPIDVALGVAGRALGLAVAASRGTAAAARAAAPLLEPLTWLGERVPVPERWRPGPRLGALGRTGAAYRTALVSELTTRLDALVPAVLAEVLSRADLTRLVLRYVDLDEIVAAVDLDRAVARVDLDAAVKRADIDAVVARVDLDPIIGRLDIDSVVAGVDLEPIIARVDVDAVARRLDIDLVLDRMDLTSVVMQRVDLDAIVQAILARIDLIALAEQVIDGVNLTEIIRESTGTMASDTVQGVRMQGIAADDAISHAMDRFLLRHGRRTTKAPESRSSEEPPGEAARHPGERVP